MPWSIFWTNATFVDRHEAIGKAFVARAFRGALGAGRGRHEAEGGAFRTIFFAGNFTIRCTSMGALGIGHKRVARWFRSMVGSLDATGHERVLRHLVIHHEQFLFVKKVWGSPTVVGYA